MICNNCKKIIEDDCKHCPFCGNIPQKSVSESNAPSDIEKGFSCLELKQWDEADLFFKNAIKNNENKVEGYIGRILARYKVDSIDNLVLKHKKFTNNNNFKLALKYADTEYAEYLKDCAKKSDLARKKKQKQIFGIGFVCFTSVMILSVLAYCVFIPFGRNYYYKSLVANGELDKAIKSYNNSKWFEYDEKAKDLFYESSLEFIEINDYKTAENCFEILKDYKDGEKYYNYCKAQNLLADNDLKAYDYFVKLDDFLDCKKIIETNEHFITLNKLQGEWKYPETTLSDIDNYMLGEGYTVDAENGIYKKNIDSVVSFEPKREAVHENSIKIDGSTVNGFVNGKFEISSSGKINIHCEDGLWTYLELNEDGTISLDNVTDGIYPFIKWKKLNNKSST